MRPPRQNPDGRSRRQPQRGNGGGGDGVHDHSELAVIFMKKLIISALTTLAGGCVTAPPAPPASAYHALGTEPFWNLLIDEHDLTFTQPDASPIRQPTPKVIIGFAGEIYRTARIDVNIVHQPCSAGMRDRRYPDRVRVPGD